MKMTVLAIAIVGGPQSHPGAIGRTTNCRLAFSSDRGDAQPPNRI